MHENKLVRLIIEQIQKDRETMSKQKQEPCPAPFQGTAGHDR